MAVQGQRSWDRVGLGQRQRVLGQRRAGSAVRQGWGKVVAKAVPEHVRVRAAAALAAAGRLVARRALLRALCIVGDDDGDDDATRGVGWRAHGFALIP